MAAAAPVGGHAQRAAGHPAVLGEGGDGVGLRGADVEVHLDEEGPVLVRLDLDGEGGVGVRDGAAPGGRISIHVEMS